MSLRRFDRLRDIHSQADLQVIIDLAELFLRQLSEIAFDPALVDRLDLFKLDHRGSRKRTVVFNQIMGRLVQLLDLRRHRRHDQGGAVEVPVIILQDQYRPRASLLRSSKWIQVCQVNIASP